MKTFFLLLLLSNLLFALVQWLFPYEQWVLVSQPLEAAEKLKLVHEPETHASVDSALDPVAVDDSPAPVPPPVSGKPCYTLGPFKERQLAKEVSARFSQVGIQIDSRPSVEKEYMGQMVFIDGHASRDDAKFTAAELKKKGINDYIIFDDADKTNALSLGVFGLKKNAERLLERVEKAGFEAQVEARYRNRTIYWLDYAELENESLVLYIDNLKTSQGISRISRRCGR